MARQMRFFLIRHGETVDNVAQVYAGSRDSELTNHGYQQATRLGLHFSSLGLSFTHIFSSHLQRAVKTAGLIREAQVARPVGKDAVSAIPDVVRLPVLMEQDFGFYEGKKWYDKPADSKSSGKEHHRQEIKDAAGFVDIESKESLAQRADTFLDGHLLPLFNDPIKDADHVIAVVSHGIILSVLWKRLLLRLPPKSVSFAPELLANTRGLSLEHLGGWSNTGYLELFMSRIAVQEPAIAADSIPPSTSDSATAQGVAGQARAEEGISDTLKIAASDTLHGEQDTSDASVRVAALATESSPPKLAHSWKTMIATVNGKDHLRGLKRTGGGVGSSRHDATQKNIDSFFKRRKLE